jgi:hypothetical protein
LHRRFALAPIEFPVENTGAADLNEFNDLMKKIAFVLICFIAHSGFALTIQEMIQKGEYTYARLSDGTVWWITGSAEAVDVTRTAMDAEADVRIKHIGPKMSDQLCFVYPQGNKDCVNATKLDVK